MGGETKSSDDLSSKDTNHFIFAKIMANDKSDSKTLKLFDSLPLTEPSICAVRKKNTSIYPYNRKEYTLFYCLFVTTSALNLFLVVTRDESLVANKSHPYSVSLNVSPLQPSIRVSPLQPSIHFTEHNMTQICLQYLMLEHLKSLFHLSFNSNILNKLKLFYYFYQYIVFRAHLFIKCK